MIGSFWNLCRACPSMPVDKLHSEYRSTYRWHEYTGPRQEVVRRPPLAASGGNTSKLQHTKSADEEPSDGGNIGTQSEPALPRRKKHPELAYKTHEFLAMADAGGSDDSLDAAVPLDRARSEERGGSRPRPSRRSKSEGPPTGSTGCCPGPGFGVNAGTGPIQSEYRLQYMRVDSPPPQGRTVRSDSDPCEGDIDQEMMIASYPPPAPAQSAGPLSNAISRISTEYRLQFAWPRGGRGHNVRTDEGKGSGASGPPRKSLSMGAIRPVANVGPVPVHKKRSNEFDHGDEGASELEPLVGVDTSLEAEELTGEDKIQDETLNKDDKHRRRKEFKTEYKKKFRPFSQYDYVEGKFQKKKPEPENEPISLPFPELPRGGSWYREVIELRKKAGEYKHRGWGTELVPQHIAELYSKQMMLWEQVSRRSSLSALSLASTTPRSISKEEKEKENNKKSSPIKQHTTRPSLKSLAHDKHLSSERRKVEKIDETKKEVPRSRKEYLIRHHLERTTGATDGALLPSPTREKLEPVIPRSKDEDLPKSPQKASPKSSPRTARSQSVGPGLSGENRSPKRQFRAPSAAPVAGVHKGQMNGPVQVERRPRPTSLTTTGPSRPKSSSAPLKSEEGKSNHTIKAKCMPAKSVNGIQPANMRGDRTKVADKKESSMDEEKQEEEPEDVTKAGSEAEETKDDFEPEIEPAVVKSPPEPTRVKSPEQIIIRSPEPVNWTVPLDTGKTFTVTQNVREAMPNVKFYRGELVNRPHSEVKAWTPPAIPPPAPQSAPPELPDQAQISSGWRSPLSDTEQDVATSPVTGPVESTTDIQNKPETDETNILPSSSTPQSETSAISSTQKCLEDPSFAFDSSTVGGGNQTKSGTQSEGGQIGQSSVSTDREEQLKCQSPERSISKMPKQDTDSSDITSQKTGEYASEEALTPSDIPPSTEILGTDIPVQEPQKVLPIVSPSSGRSLASDVLEKARTRFDKFWGKGKDSPDKEGKV
ncbi:hypothetical protein R5R35_003949 [Gryllus longicercus]|uniref:Nuclear protein MDM1 n=1 Tax=Gryllus longicercus TaxID=2509291 RepID=A0AAN9VCZ0_9ORTH